MKNNINQPKGAKKLNMQTWIVWNIDFTLYSKEQLEQLYFAVEKMDTSISKAIEEYLEELKKCKCETCNIKDAKMLHTCPYESEINDNIESLCNCCDSCKSECQDAI